MRIGIPQEPGCEVGLNCDQIEPPHEEQQSLQGVERNPNAYRSIGGLHDTSMGKCTLLHCASN